jgi:hypothetical protein
MYVVIAAAAAAAAGMGRAWTHGSEKSRQRINDLKETLEKLRSEKEEAEAEGGGSSEDNNTEEEEEEEEEEEDIPFEGSLGHYYEQMTRAEETLDGEHLDTFREAERDLEEFLLTCKKEFGIRVQQSIIGAITVRMCMLGMDDRFPSNPNMITFLFEEFESVLAVAVKEAALDPEQRLLGLAACAKFMRAMSGVESKYEEFYRVFA